MLVSVIVPVYNVEPYLRDALDSLLRQTYSDLEILLIDDGSTDGSSSICDEYARNDSRIRVFHQTNRGLSAARNVGLDNSTGTYITFLDPDDSYQPDFVSALLTSISDADLSICRTTNPRRRKNPIPSGTYDRISTLRALADGHIGPAVWNKLYRASLWDDIRFPVGHVYEDTDVMFRILDKAQRTVVIDDALYNHRYRKDSISHTMSPKYRYDLYLAHTHFLMFMKRNTPAIFSSDQLERRQQGRLKNMMVCFGFCKGEDESLEREMRKRILDEKGSEALVRLSQWMIRYVPFVFKLACAVYYPIRMKLRALRYPSQKSKGSFFHPI